MPNSYNNYGSVTKEEALVFLGSGQLAGVQSVDLNYTNNSQETKYLGMSKCNNLPVGPKVGSFGVSYYLISNDLVTQYTGSSGCNGYILRSRSSQTDNFSFISGYLTNYTCRMSVGEIPQINANFAIFGDVGKFATNETTDVTRELNRIANSNPTLNFTPTAPHNILINLDDYSTNRVLSCDISITSQRLPVYNLGDRDPVAVKYIPPHLVDVTFTIEKNNYAGHQLTDYPFLENIADLDISLLQLNQYNPILRFKFDGMTLKSEGYNTNIDRRGVITVSYRNYYI